MGEQRGYGAAHPPPHRSLRLSRRPESGRCRRSDLLLMSAGLICILREGESQACRFCALLLPARFPLCLASSASAR